MGQKLVEGYEEGNPEKCEDSLLHRVMDSIIDCSTTNFANEAAFNKWKAKVLVDLSWNYFENTWKKLYLNKNKGGDLWDLAVNGELTKNQIKVGKNPRSSGGNKSGGKNQNNTQANAQSPPNHENDHQQDIEGNNNDNDESTITDSPEVQENATTHDQQEEQGNTVEDLSTNDESTDDSSDDDDEEIESPVTVNENERIGSYAMEEAQQENFDLFSVTNTPPRVVNNDSSQTPVTVAWNGTPNSNYNDYPYNTLFKNNPSYTTKNRTPLLSSRGVICLVNIH